MTDRLPHALYRAAQVRALDAVAIERHGIPGEVLMERAGAAAFALLRARWPGARRLVVLAGAGNNGGDGYVVARLALAAGWQVRLLQCGDHARLHGAALTAAQAYAAVGGSTAPYAGLPRDCDLICDALLGTGLQRPVTSRWAEAIAACNASSAPVLALDLPSGLDADTGQVLGVAVRAAATISFIGLKQGLFTGCGPDQTGRVHFAGLRVPAAIYATEILSARRIDWAREGPRLPPRRPGTHKGECGYVLVLGGAPGMSGAVRLCGAAALRAGAGLVTVATHPAHAALVNLTCPELMVQPLGDPAGLATVAARADVIAIGPGLGQDDWAQGLLAAALTLGRPLVVDADALNLLALAPDRAGRRDDWVLTPHPREAARLLGASVATVESDRFAAVAALQARYGGTVVLKGAGSLVRGPGSYSPAVCTDGNPGMATAGMGDALTGIIAALIAQARGRAGPDEPVAALLEPAASAGVCLHAAAGDRAARDGQRGLLASDLIESVRAVLASTEAPRPAAR
ncbi:MAG: NAD(P)H-hydrate dehydratase [Chromatiaceae bacterium]|nr:MAG: NAD(P)H-hydrate dehydratase [Chromatiaceae bacterium]